LKSRTVVVIVANRLAGVVVEDEKEIGIYQVSGHHKGATEWCGDDHTAARAGGRRQRLGSTRGTMAPPAPSHTSLRGLEDTASAPGDGRTERRRRSTGVWRRRTKTLATEGFGAATRGSIGRIKRGGGVDPKVLVLCNQRRRPGWPGLALIRAGGGGGGVRVESRVPSEVRRGMGASVGSDRPIDRVDLDWLASWVGLLGQLNGPGPAELE
jgi:hypothetical protein